jgi:hypothetical protein
MQPIFPNPVPTSLNRKCGFEPATGTFFSVNGILI